MIDEKKEKKNPIYRYSGWIPITWIFMGIGIYQLSNFIISLRLKDPELWFEVLEVTGMTEFNFYIGIGMFSASLAIISIGGWIYFLKEKMA